MQKFNTDEKIASILKANGAFFAFSMKQFEEQSQEGINYKNLGSGLVCPEENIEQTLEEFTAVIKEKIDWELANNTKKDIIWYELANHECQISYDLSQVIAILNDYGITEDEIRAEWPGYIDHCIENDYF